MAFLLWINLTQTPKVPVYTRINHASLDPVVIANDEISMAVTSYTGDLRNVDWLS